jgi:hypothetical protein
MQVEWLTEDQAIRKVYDRLGRQSLKSLDHQASIGFAEGLNIPPANNNNDKFFKE